MKITLVTIRVPLKPEYKGAEDKWLDTYIQFKPSIPHELIVVDSDSAAPHGKHDEHASKFLVYSGGGQDCGTWQWIPTVVESDLFICCNTRTHFWKHGWMERFVEEIKRHGNGLYGTTASYEYYPHIRPSCIAFQHEVIECYPHTIDSRSACLHFESFNKESCWTSLCRKNGYKTLMVTWDGCYDIQDWRKPPNVFRRGDQSNVIVKDGHTDYFDGCDSHWKSFYSAVADGKRNDGTTINIEDYL